MRHVHYHRRRNTSSQKKRRIVGVVFLIGIIAIAYGLFTFLRSLSFAPNQTRSALMTTDTPNLVSVQLEAGQWNTDLTNVKLYPENSVRTDTATAELLLFDSSTLALDENTSIRIDSMHSNETSGETNFTLTEGRVLIQTSSDSNLEMNRTISIPGARISIPSATIALIDSNSIAVLEDNSFGVTLETDTISEPIIIGEGQVLTIPETGLLDNAEQNYTFRSALNINGNADTFIQKYLVTTESGSTVTATTTLEITNPEDNAIINASTVRVTGTVSEEIAEVTINGFSTTVTNGAFSAEVALEDTETVLTIAALDEEGQTVEEKVRTVQKDSTPSSAPIITTPVGNGETYTTTDNTVVIRGTVPADTEAVIVNDYELQLYTPGQTSWQYLAQAALGNLVIGSNTYTITATNSAGIQSEPAVITIVYGTTPASSTSSSNNSTNQASSVPVTTGTQDPNALTITAPTTNGSLTTSNSDILIEGTTNENVQSVWVNGYQLQLFEPSKQFWNYIANVELGTLSEGSNTYTVQARNAQNQIIDSETYIIEYQPE